MSLNDDLTNYYKEVWKLREQNSLTKSKNNVSQEVVNVNEIYENAISNIDRSSHYLNETTSKTVTERTAANAISVGNKVAPLMVSLKEMADNMYKNNKIEGFDINKEEQLQNCLSKSEDNLSSLHDLVKANNKFIQNFTHLVEYFKNQDEVDDHLSTGSEISSFFEKDVVTSSPINP